MRFIGLNTAGYAIDVEDKLHGLMKPYPIGIYSSMKLEPVMVPSRQYHYYDAKNNKIQVSELKDIKKPVLDEKDNVVIGTWLVRHKENNLSNEPILPYWGTKLVILAIEDTLNSIAPYRRTSYHSLDHMLFSNMAITDNYDNVLAVVNQILDDLVREVLEFVGNDRWNIYHVEFKHGEIKITQDQDYRILQWEEMQKAKLADDSGE